MFKINDKLSLDREAQANINNPLPSLYNATAPFTVIAVNAGFPRMITVRDADGTVIDGVYPTRFKAFVPTPKARTLGEVLEEARGPAKFWIISLVNDGKVEPACPAKTYTSFAQAEAVSRIMAEKHIGKQFVVLEAVAVSILPQKSASTRRI